MSAGRFEQEPVVGLASGARLRVGGQASDAEIAAVIAAIDAVLRGEQDEQPDVGERPGWVQAARLEGVGQPQVATRADLRTRW